MKDNNVSASNGQAGPHTFVLESALAYQAAGRSVLPIAPGSKAPSILSPTTGEIIEISWKTYQKDPATRDQLIKWLRVPHPMGIGIACGPVSGVTLDDGIRAALETLDFDAWQVYEAFVQLAVVQGLDGLLARLHVKEQTPRPGIHLPYLCIEVAKNTPLAREKVGTLPNGKDQVKALIETRGIGGQVVVAPTPPGIHPDCPQNGYELLSGDWREIPVITPEEREALWNCARALNRYTPDERSQRRQQTSIADQDLIGNDYNERVSQDDILHLLEAHGWQKTYTRNEASYLLRPGKSGRGWSATLGELAPKRFYVFSSSAEPFENDRSYDPFGVYTRLEHRNDFKAAAKALAEQGYGRNGQPSGNTRKAQDQTYHTGTNGDIGDDQQEAEQEIHDDPKSQPIGPYLIKWSPAKGTALYYQKPGTTDEQQLANFMAWIIEERLEDDGAESIRMVTMDATLISGKQFPEIRIAVPEFYSLVGLMKALGTEAVVSPGPLVKDRIRHAIQLYSNRQKYPQRHVFTHLGWRQVDGVWCYLHAGGSIPAKAEVSVDKALQRYILPQTGSAQAAIKASLRVLECAPKRLTIPLLSMVYLAPLAHWLDPDVTGWLEGPSGAQKSSLVALIMCHYGHFSRVHPPDTWESTANTLERLAFLAKDILLWIDDYAPQPSAKEMHEQERKAQRVIRAQGNLSGRGRMRADTSLRPQYYPRGVILSTGELHPTGTSTFARLLQLDVTNGDIKLDALTTSQADAHLLAEAMAVYVGWLQSQIETLPSILKARWNELRTDALPHLTHHSRHPEVYAHLATAWELFLNCACSLGAIDEAERQAYWHVGCETLMQAINRQRLDAEAEDPVHRFCSHVKEALIQGKAYLDDVRGGYPDDAGQWGWTMQSFHHNDGTVSDEWKPSQGASMLGWVDKDFVYLLPDAAYRLAFENLQRSGVTLLPQQTLWKRLIDRGYVQRGENRYTTRKRVGSDRPHVLKVVRRYVEDHLSPQSGDSGDTGDNEP